VTPVLPWTPPTELGHVQRLGRVHGSRISADRNVEMENVIASVRTASPTARKPGARLSGGHREALSTRIGTPVRSYITSGAERTWQRGQVDSTRSAVRTDAGTSDGPPLASSLRQCGLTCARARPQHGLGDKHLHLVEAAAERHVINHQEQTASGFITAGHPLRRQPSRKTRGCLPGPPLARST
jgi:hypothetical protein